MLQASPHSLEVGGDHRRKAGRIAVGNGHRQLGARVIDGGVEAPVGVHRAIDQSGHLGLDGHVSLHERGRAASHLNAMHSLLAAFGIDVVDDYRGTRPAKSSAMARPQACPAPVTSTTLLIQSGIATTVQISEHASARFADS